MRNPWNRLTSLYGIVKNDSDITSDNADNILVAWPVIIDAINIFGQKEKDTRILEYGCGTGSFAYKLSRLGYDVTGVDTSKEMIKTAKLAFGKDINFLTGDSSILSEKKRFSIITSIMTFQFIENIEKTFMNLTKILKPGGIFVFAVFNPTFTKECLRMQTLFEDFDSFEKPKKGYLKLDGNRIPVFIRTALEYNNLLKQLDFEPFLESYPPFTEEFLKEYPLSNLIDEPEFLILGYKKSN